MSEDRRADGERLAAVGENRIIMGWKLVNSEYELTSGSEQQQ
jgi:hypothetical protein